MVCPIKLPIFQATTSDSFLIPNCCPIFFCHCSWRKKGWGQIASLEHMVRFGWNLAQLFGHIPWAPVPSCPPNPTFRKVNTYVRVNISALLEQKNVCLDIYCYEVRALLEYVLFLCFWCFFLHNTYRHTCYCSSSAEILTFRCELF